MSATLDKAPPQQELPPHVIQWKTTWHDFNRAIRSPQPFHQWYWIQQLASSASKYVLGAAGLERIAFSTYHIKQRLQSILPVFGLALIAFIWWSYLSSLRPMLREEWCSTTEETSSSCLLKDRVHSSMVAYLIVMIAWHFVLVCFSSPGVALPNDNASSTTRNNIQWKATEAQGGFCCFNPPLDIHREVQRVDSYGTLDKSKVLRKRPPLPPDNASWEFPFTNPSYCDKCDIIRPPRCHHCKVCDRCVLQVSLVDECVSSFRLLMRPPPHNYVTIHQT